MKTIATATIVLALAFVAFGRDIPNRLAPKIIHGNTTSDGKYPYTVSLRVYNEHFCGGSILNNRWILTSASCIIGKRPDEISVITGTNYLAESGYMYQAILKITHPQFSKATLINDVGLILVSRKIVFIDKIQPISLPTENFNKVDYPAVFSGWGSITVNGDFAARLQEINLSVISQEVCASNQTRVTNGNICTLTEIGKGLCRGDEGGPLVADSVQIGISSYTSCAIGKPDVYTRVWSFLEWIDKTIEENNEMID